MLRGISSGICSGILIVRALYMLILVFSQMILDFKEFVVLKFVYFFDRCPSNNEKDIMRNLKFSKYLRKRSSKLHLEILNLSNNNDRQLRKYEKKYLK